MEDAFLFRHGLSPSSRQPDLPDAAQTVPVLLNRAVMARPSDEALVGPGARFSYEALSLASQRAAMMLREIGIAPGDRVAASLPNGTEIVVAFLAAMRIGAIFVGIPHDWSLDDTLLAVVETDTALLLVDQAGHDALAPRRAALRDLGRVLVAEPGNSEWNLSVDREEDLADFDDIDPFAPALVSYERAPDGRPRGIVHSQHNLLLPGTVDASEFATPGVRRGVSLPLTGVEGLVRGPLHALHREGCCVTLGGADPSVACEALREESLDSLAADPGSVAALLAHDGVADDELAELASLDVVLAARQALPDGLLALHRERLGRPARLGYGLGEGPGAVTLTRPDESPLDAAGRGRAQPHLDVVILGDDDRELPDGKRGRVGLRPNGRGPYTMAWTPILGYWNRPDATRAALHGGVFRTEAQGHLDADGELFLAS